MTGTEIVAEPGRQEIVIKRVFDAPRQRVFRAHTDPKRMRQWLGPRNLTVSQFEMDAKTGGSYHYAHRDPEGNVHSFRGVFHEVLENERIIQTFEYEPVPGHVSLETLVFEEVDGKTRLVIRSVFQSVEDRDGMIRSGMEVGVNEGYERLDELLATR